MSPLIRSMRPRTPRRGVTLVEMLVAVALLVLMMTVIVQVLVAATGAVSTQRVYQELDSSLRQLESTLRQDLSNTTARMTPGLTSPNEERGYFEYIENSFADLQGEDADDCLKFTVKAPEGQVFTGRMYLQPAAGRSNFTGYNSAAFVPPHQPVTITSQYAEIIYFLRAGNLYRRVLLVAPERQAAVSQPGSTSAGKNQFFTTAFGSLFPVGWLGVNDLSAHPAATLNNSSSDSIILNSLGDLTNRENRYASPRFINDFVQAIQAQGSSGFNPDGVFDDQNNDTVPDYYPTLYYNMINGNAKISINGAPQISAINEVWTNGFNSLTGRPAASAHTMAFPFIYPYAYSRPDVNTAGATGGGGWIHTPDPNMVVGKGGVTWLSMLNALNHNPLPGGDSLVPPVPGAGLGIETWWGFPTWRETMSPAWNDPFFGPINALNAGQQSVGLTPLNPSGVVPAATTADWLPPMTANVRLVSQFDADGAGSGSSFLATSPFAPGLGQQLWEDDLIMTGVRSFDVKAYDDSFPGYVDLGWGDDLRLYSPFIASGTLATATPPNLGLTGAVKYSGPFVPAYLWPPAGAGAKLWNLYTQTFAHEGRIPALSNDLRMDPNVAKDTQSGTQIFYQDDSTDTVRLRRTWDSWSTDYSRAPASGINPLTGQPQGYPYGGAPIYPSFPPPYEAPLRGLQIQVRVVDPRNERLKVLTIRQDFSDKL